MTKYFLLAVGAMTTIVLDQVSKAWAVSTLAVSGALPADAAHIRGPGYTTQVVFESWWNYKLAGNKGGAWGLFKNLPDEWRVFFFVAISIVAIVVIISLFRKAEQVMLQAALTLILGGAIGNLIDRVRLGFVVDFIDWHTNDSWHWATFNVADVAISVGVGLLLLDMLVNGRKKPEDELDELTA
jgi:signal peptidase II